MAAKDNGARDGKKCDRMYEVRRRKKHTQTHKGRMKKVYAQTLAQSVYYSMSFFRVCVCVC